MLPRAFLPAAAALLAGGLVLARAQETPTSDLGFGAEETTATTLIPLKAPSQPSSAIFRNELTDVEIKDTTPTGPADFGTLYSGAQKTGSSLYMRQQFGDQLTLENTSTVGMQSGGELSAQYLGQGAASTWGDGASAYNTMTATFAPVSTLKISATEITENDLSDDTGTQGEMLLMETQNFQAAWQATPKTSITFGSRLERDYDSGSLAFDTYRQTGATISQALGKSNLTWNVAPSWQEDTMGAAPGGEASIQSGPQMGTSLDWKPVTGTKWSVGTTWSQLEGVSNALAQETRDVFLAYDHAISQKLHFQLRTEGRDVQTPEAVAANNGTPADQKQLSVQVGQRVTLSDTLTAAVDFTHTVQQQDRDAWTTAESMATFSLQKSF